ncbi:hypothetical protein [Cellulomonas marina]|uniref:hypothetical protein n=1 Tax=Cellulomonas marina TaxID=988821 RepID=UPI001586FE47|nr:hypothetical protein [Cellulomonas marina]
MQTTTDAPTSRPDDRAGAWWAPAREDRHRQACARVVLAVPGVTVSHASAAALHGLPVPVRLGAVEVTRVVHRWRPGVRGALVRVVRRPPGAVVLGGVPVTSVARTVVDVARTRPSPVALTVADAALRAGLVSAEELDEEVDRAGAGPGVRAARRVVAHADGRSRSPEESVSRARLLEAGVALPVLHPSPTDAGPGVAFWWPRHGAAGRLVPAGHAARGHPWTVEGRVRVVAWTWADALAGAPVVARLGAAGVR